jgi:2-polyprenyl-3-methyl-5-hydroxy-6-metoxy-1,4-benzoquinol methylase
MGYPSHFKGTRRRHECRCGTLKRAPQIQCIVAQALVLAIVGEVLCESLPVLAGDRVLDVGTAPGDTAISAACRRAIVTGVDLVPALLRHARRRAQADAFEIDFQEGNAMAVSAESAERLA